MSMTFFTLAFGVLAIASGTFALTCYYCVLGNAVCGEPFDAFAKGVYIISNCTSCSKITIGSIVSRGCGTAFNGCKDDVSGQSTCNCFTNLCNGSSHITVTIGTVLLGHVIMILKNLF
ncbi:uncharacterized protein LOC127853948 [Dreissena polymorpha]|uniref:UPAR/Ly6 domain-containing protein n=1 Tax=Dreissena polymorpha TaxID=45954 RepID=A0A9D4CJZ2_DREPO|nr:uncharacterized protein LOC127853948 [Dreissena polymorpha]KAH3726044.1 hypothetical protein DPMN_051899 [Dreissena polymorpha]